MADEKIKQAIKNGEVALGVEFGSTTVKAILTTEDFKTIASGSYEWDNSLQDGLWTYAIDDIWLGLQTAYSNLRKKVFVDYNVEIKKSKPWDFQR
jgi:sugar (pentulose or hexulose) kinase